MNGALIGEADSANLEWIGDPMPVDSLAKDLLGFYPVPKHCLMTVEAFVIADGSGINPSEPFMGNEIVTIKGQFGGSGMSYEGDGMVQGPAVQSSPTNPSKWTFKVLAEAKPLS